MPSQNKGSIMVPWCSEFSSSCYVVQKRALHTYPYKLRAGTEPVTLLIGHGRFLLVLLASDYQLVLKILDFWWESNQSSLVRVPGIFSPLRHPLDLG